MVDTVEVDPGMYKYVNIKVFRIFIFEASLVLNFLI